MIAFISLSHFSIPRLVFLFPNKLFALMPWLRICMWETQTQTVILSFFFLYSFQIQCLFCKIYLNLSFLLKKNGDNNACTTFLTQIL